MFGGEDQLSVDERDHPDVSNISTLDGNRSQLSCGEGSERTTESSDRSTDSRNDVCFCSWEGVSNSCEKWANISNQPFVWTILVVKEL